MLLHRRLIAGLAAFFFILSGCEMLALNDEHGTDKLSVYDQYWNIVNEKYAMFEAKNVDWNVVRDTTRNKISHDMPDEEFWQVMGSMATVLHDGHSYLIRGEELAGWDGLLDGYDRNLDANQLNHYLTGAQTINESDLIYNILDGNIGYLLILSFDADFDEEDIETVIDYLKDTDGLIIDVRGNGGGDPFLAAYLAGHFTDKEVYAGFERFKTGPGPNDFSDSEMNVIPQGTYYSKPVIVLTNRECYSATTTMIYMMNPLDNVTFMGDRTGGGSGSTADGHLSNGWIWSLSTSEFIDFEGNHLDDGFDPDIFVSLDEMDTSKDEIIERALLELK